MSQDDLFAHHNPFGPEAMAAARARREQQQKDSLDALLRLCKVAQGGSGQCHHVRRFLLGLYNCKKWPFELNRLRNLDRNIAEDCFTVLRLDVAAYQEIHQYIKNGDQLWRSWWELEDSE